MVLDGSLEPEETGDDDNEEVKNEFVVYTEAEEATPFAKFEEIVAVDCAEFGITSAGDVVTCEFEVCVVFVTVVSLEIVSTPTVEAAGCKLTLEVS